MKHVGRPHDKAKDQQIMQAARQLLLKEGILGLTMESVAREAQVSKTTLYKRYANRQQLIEAVLDFQTDFFTESLKLPVSSEEEAKLCLEDACVRLLDYLLSEEQVCLLKLVQAGESISSSQRLDWYQRGPGQTAQALEQWLERMQQLGFMQAKPHLASADLLFGLLIGMDLLRQMFGQAVRLTPAIRRAHVQTSVAIFWSLYQ